MNRTRGWESRWMAALVTTGALSSTAWCQSLSVPEAPLPDGDAVTIKARVIADALPPAPLPDPQLGGTAIPIDAKVAPKLSASELESLVASVALQPDEVLDNILDAVQQPALLKQAATALRDKAALPADLPASVKFLADKHPKVLAELNDNLLLMTRLGLAVKAQPEDVVAAIRSVRTKAGQMANQANDAAGQSVYSLPISGGTYYGDSGVYTGTSYPCYCYYTYGLPSYYYGYGYGYPYYGYGYGYGGYGYGYGYPYGSIARLTLGIIYAANGPYYPYGYYPWYGGAYPWFGYGHWGHAHAAAHYHGPHGGFGYVNSIYGYGPHGALYRSGASTGTFVGPNGVGSFNAASNSVRFNNGVTAFAAGRGAATINAANGNTINVAGAGIAGKTTFGNTTTFGSAGALGFQSTGGANGLATHVGGGSVVNNGNGTYGFNRTSTNTLSGVNGSVTTNHTGQGTYAGGGNGSYTGSTSVQGSGGKGGTVNTTYNNGNLDVDVNPNNPNSPLGNKAANSSALANQTGNQALGNGAANRLSGANGNGGATNGLPSQGFANLSNGGNTAGGGSGLRNQLSQPTGSNTTPRSLSGHGSGNTGATGLGNRFGGYGNLAPNAGGGATGLGSSNALGSRATTGGAGLGSNNFNVPAGTNFNGQATPRSNLGSGNGLGSNAGTNVGSNFGGGNNTFNNAAPRASTPASGFNPTGNFNPIRSGGSSSPSRSVGGGSFGGSSFGGGGSIGGGSSGFRGGSIGGGGGGMRSGGGGFGGGGGGGRGGGGRR